MLAGVASAILSCLGPAMAAEPIFTERFDDEAGRLEPVLKRWSVSSGLDSALRTDRIRLMTDAGGLRFVRISVQEGDAWDAPAHANRADRAFVCSKDGSIAGQFADDAPNERVELQVRADRRTGAGELVRFGETVWYRFSFRVPDSGLRDQPVTGRSACRTVIHQIKQNASKNGKSCGISPFLKIEAQPVGAGFTLFAQIASGQACGEEAAVKRTRLCEIKSLANDVWTDVHMRLLPAQDEGGRLTMWVNGQLCGSYAGPMGDGVNGVRRNGAPFVDTQPRFGIYRDWRAETQSIDLRRIMFWNDDPAEHPDWVKAP